MKYRISKAASKDLEEIWLYTFTNCSVEQADRYFNLIMSEIEYITENPEAGTEYGNIRKGYFRSKVNAHFIFYRINRKIDTVEIIRILHQRMDIDVRLYE